MNSKWGKDTTDPAVVLSLPPLRQTLFRGVWAEGSNKYFGEANRSSMWTATQEGNGPGTEKILRRSGVADLAAADESVKRVASLEKKRLAEAKL